MTAAVAVVDPRTATAAEIREWSIAVRTRIPVMSSDELAQLEALLIAVKHRLKQLGKDIAETERTRIRAVQRIGVLLGPPVTERADDGTFTASGKNEAVNRAEWDRRHQARLLAAYPTVVDEALEKAKPPSLSAVVKLCQRQRAAEQVAEVVARMAEVLDEDADPAEAATTGRWWQLGEHLLYCGDSADEEFVTRAKGAAFAFADPPYNAGKADWDHGFAWRHDYLADIADVAVVTPGISAIADFFRVTEMPYRWSMSAWITNGMTRGALGFGNWIYLALFSNAESIHRNAQDHMRVTVDASTTDESAHESRKPVRLIVDLLELFTSERDTVVDPFLGSGTTLFAAEQTGRRCIGAEIDPGYVAEIVARYGSGAKQL